MSQETLSNPQVRAKQNRWYLYFSRDPRYGECGRVRAVIEEACDEILNGDGGPKRHYRNVYLDALDVRDSPTPPIAADIAIYDGLDQAIEAEMSDEEFHRLIAEGIVVPISSA
jgi:hypothetical protein